VARGRCTPMALAVSFADGLLTRGCLVWSAAGRRWPWQRPARVRDGQRRRRRRVCGRNDQADAPGVRSRDFIGRRLNVQEHHAVVRPLSLSPSLQSFVLIYINRYERGYKSFLSAGPPVFGHLRLAGLALAPWQPRQLDQVARRPPRQQRTHLHMPVSSLALRISAIQVVRRRTPFPSAADPAR
jgi:hypothetical protein